MINYKSFLTKVNIMIFYVLCHIEYRILGQFKTSSAELLKKIFLKFTSIQMHGCFYYASLDSVLGKNPCSYNA